MKKNYYGILGLILALSIIISNGQIINVSAQESNTSVQNTVEQTLADEDDTQEAIDQSGSDVVQTEEEMKTDEAQMGEQSGAEQTEEKSGQSEEQIVSGSDDVDESVTNEENAEDQTDSEGGQSWEDANSWRYQNGQLITIQTYAGTGQYTTWPDVDGTVAKGIDVSEHQGTIDWNKVKAAGVDYAIIRCGYGDNYTSQDDKQWMRNVSECERLGIPYGVYIYSYAMSTMAAQSEAEHVLRLLQGHNPTYPVYLDLENDGWSYAANGNAVYSPTYDLTRLGAKGLGDVAETFCSIISNAGYKTGIYANTNWFESYLTDSRFNQWDRWVAQYNTTCTYSGNYTMWQCSSQGIVNGISGAVDLNLDFGTVETRPDTSSAKIVYQAHVQDIGWQVERVDGNTAGTTGRSKQMEALTISKAGVTQNISGDIKYRAHVQDIGEQGWVSNGAIAGTTGQGKRIEAVQIALTGNLAQQYDVYYHVHVQNIGWMKWVKGGENDSSWTGSKGLGLAIEAVEIQLVEKGGQIPASNAAYSYLTTDAIGTLSYVVHQQDYGTLPAVLSGGLAGKTGEAKRLEAAWIAVHGATLSGNIQYRAHVQDIGWQSWVSSGNTAGTTGQSKRMEAIQITLSGELGAVCDVWYRVHVQNYGWLGWAKDGQTAGTTGIGYRIESIQIQIVPKGTNPPGVNSGYYKSVKI